METALCLRNEGLTFREIGERYGCTKQAVENLLKRNGVGTRKNGKIFANIPYAGLYKFFAENRKMSVAGFSYAVFGKNINTQKCNHAKARRLLEGRNETLTLNNIRRMLALTGMTFEELFAEREDLRNG